MVPRRSGTGAAAGGAVRCSNARGGAGVQSLDGGDGVRGDAEEAQDLGEAGEVGHRESAGEVEIRDVERALRDKWASSMQPVSVRSC